MAGTVEYPWDALASGRLEGIGVEALAVEQVRHRWEHIEWESSAGLIVRRWLAGRNEVGGCSLET